MILHMDLHFCDYSDIMKNKTNGRTWLNENQSQLLLDKEFWKCLYSTILTNNIAKKLASVYKIQKMIPCRQYNTDVNSQCLSIIIK